MRVFSWLDALVVGLSALSLVAGQQSAPFIDAQTGISGQEYRRGDFAFGIALPTNPTNEFIGRLRFGGTREDEKWGKAARKLWVRIGPVNTGYSAIEFGQGMVGNLILVAWANSNKVISSFRYATSYTDPVIYQGSASATTLSQTVNSTHFTYIFRCQNCVSWSYDGVTGGFDPTADTTVFSWAMANSGTADLSNPTSDIRQHNAGFGSFGISIGSAKSSQYSTWAKIGQSSTTTTTTTTRTTTTATASPTGSALPVPSTTFDYIVIGGGAGGMVAADRLSETGKSVLLIERGPPSTYVHGGRNGPSWAVPNQLTRYDIPALCNQIWFDSRGISCTDYDQMAGCVLGGGTAINAGLFFKGADDDWDTNFPEGWKSSDMAGPTSKVFKRIPSTDNPSMNGVRYSQEAYTVLSRAMSAVGYKSVVANDSPNEKNRTYSRAPYMFINGERGGPLATYLVSAKSRSNFKVWTNTTVARVVRSGSKVVGVDVEAFGLGGYSGRVSVGSGGRVVLSAGTFGTAKILLRSGIGPADQLEVVRSVEGDKMAPQSDWINLPVGYNLLDHTETDVIIRDSSVTHYDWQGAYSNPNTTDRDLYLSSRAGILATAAPGISTTIWERIPSTDGKTWRQIQWYARADGFQAGSVTMASYLGTGMTSRGRTTITSSLNMRVSTSPYATKDEEDVRAIVIGVTNFINAVKSAGVTVTNPSSGTNIESWVRGYSGGRGSNHWLGSAKLGKDDGRLFNGTSGAVVDLDTKVYGTDNLFVVDASVFPGHVATNPTGPILIMAERAIERILALSSTTTSTTTSVSQTTTTSAVSSTCAPVVTVTAPTPTVTVTGPPLTVTVTLDPQVSTTNGVCTFTATVTAPASTVTLPDITVTVTAGVSQTTTTQIPTTTTQTTTTTTRTTTTQTTTTTTTQTTTTTTRTTTTQTTTSPTASATPLNLAFLSGTDYFRSTNAIAIYEWNPATANLTLRNTVTNVLAAGSFITVHPNKQNLYVSNEQTRGACAVTSFRIDASAKTVTKLLDTTFTGAGAANSAIDPFGKFVVGSCYDGGNVGVLAVRSSDGAATPLVQSVAFTGTGPNSRQDHSRPHQTVWSKDGRFAYIPDLGADKIWIENYDATTGTMTSNTYAALPAGSGPRHIAFHTTLPYAYSIQEISSTIASWSVSSSTGQLALLSTPVSCLPSSFTGTNTAAEILIHPTLPYVYGSNRGADTVAVFKINTGDGSLTKVVDVSSSGKGPRSMAFWDGYLVVAYTGTNSIVVFEVDSSSGRLSVKNTITGVPMPPFTIAFA
ncbi:hypothetical protein HDV00_005068 [Rhizophlyctis rosea]|nr:hypothetical protein HDV00_005068 [Rhizophlyctis rosea]